MSDTAPRSHAVTPAVGSSSAAAIGQPVAETAETGRAAVTASVQALPRVAFITEGEDADEALAATGMPPSDSAPDIVVTFATAKAQ